MFRTLLVCTTYALNTLTLSDSVSTQPSEPSDNKRPDALNRLVAVRSALRTGTVRWSVTKRAGGSRNTRHYTSRFTNNERILIDHGDDNGVVTPTHGNGAPSPLAALPRSTLSYDKEVWLIIDKPIQGELFVDMRFAPNPAPRSMGVATGWPDRDIHELVWRVSGQQPTPSRFEESTLPNSLRRVLDRRDTGVIEYTIDPSKDWNAVKVVRRDTDGRVFAEVRTTLKKFDTVWFPNRIEAYYPRKDGGKEPAEVYEISSAVFNLPNDPKKLTPNHIGIVAGTLLNVRTKKWSNNEIMVFDGNKPVTQAEFGRGVKNGTVKVDPSIRQEWDKMARGRGLAPSWLRNADAKAGEKAMSFEWTEFTKAFVKTHDLNSEQTAAAFGVLRDCELRARSYLDSHLDEMKVVGADLTSAAFGKGKMKPAVDRAIAFRKPLEQIFSDQLKPRLEGLLTREQRARATPPSSQP